jgi:hypothetical protein
LFISNRRLSTTLATATAVTTLTAATTITTLAKSTTSTATCSGPAFSRFLFTRGACQRRLFSSGGSGNSKALGLLLANYFSNCFTT